MEYYQDLARELKKLQYMKKRERERESVCFGLMAYQLFLGYLMPKPFSLEEQYYLTHSWEDKGGGHTFPKSICPKVNVIARLEYELAYYDSEVHRFNHYTTRTPPERECMYVHVCVYEGERKRERERKCV